MSRNICKLNDCSGIAHGAGLCAKHYGRFLYHGRKLVSVHERHGLRHTPEYNAWVGIKTRCLNKNRPEYANYGGRGITIDERWAKSFSAFYKDVGQRPTDKHSIDRIDNNRGYKPGNVRWATPSQQCFNRRVFSSNTSGHRGVSKYGKKFMVYSNASGKRKTVGYSHTIEEAVFIRDTYEQQFQLI